MTSDTNLAVGAVLFGMIGCGGSAHSVSGEAGSELGGTASADARDGSGDAPDTGTTDAVCSMEGWDPGAAAVAPRDQGMLVLAQIGAFDGFYSGVFSASFSRGGQLVVPPPLPVSGGHIDTGPGVRTLGTFGACVVTTTACAIPPSPCARPQAGKLKFGPPDELSGPLSPNLDGTYIPVGLLNGPSFVPGDTQAVVATGGDLPPFSLQVTSPGCIALLEPAMTPVTTDASVYPSQYVIARSRDLALAWAGGKTGAAVGVEVNDGKVDVSCSFHAADGQGTIPQQALVALGASAYLNTFQETSVTARIGTFNVKFAVRNLGGEYSAPDAGTCGVSNGLVTFE